MCLGGNAGHYTFLLEEGAPHRGERLRSLFFKYVKVNLGHGSSQIPEGVPPPIKRMTWKPEGSCLHSKLLISHASRDFETHSHSLRGRLDVFLEMTCARGTNRTGSIGVYDETTKTSSGMTRTTSQNHATVETLYHVLPT